MLQTARMAVTIGPKDVNLYESPLPDLLYKATGITPEEDGDRLAHRPRCDRLGDEGGGTTRTEAGIFGVLPPAMAADGHELSLGRLATEA